MHRGLSSEWSPAPVSSTHYQSFLLPGPVPGPYPSEQGQLFYNVLLLIFSPQLCFPFLSFAGKTEAVGVRRVSPSLHPVLIPWNSSGSPPLLFTTGDLIILCLASCPSALPPHPHLPPSLATAVSHAIDTCPLPLPILTPP
jgi:hypothetical protein